MTNATATLRPSTALNDDLAQLSRASGGLAPPVRAVLFGEARFEQHGRSLAATHEVRPLARGGGRFFPRIEDNMAVLRQARGMLERHAQEGLHLGPAAVWLLDNAALLDEQLQAIRQGLPRGFFRLLPQLRDEPLAGLPRIYGVAWAWVAHTDSGLDTHLLQAYLRAYQQTRALTLAELWALPTTLRVVLLENLRRLAERTALTQAARDAAHQWLDQDDAVRDMADLDALAGQLVARGVGEAFVLQLQQREDGLPPAQARELAAWLSLRLFDAGGALARQQAQATEDHQSIRNAITTLRALDRVRWRDLFGRTNAVMACLAAVPVHAAESDESQDATLHAVERLAREAKRPEAEVATTLCALTHSSADTSADTSAPSAAPRHWWGGAGQAALRQALGLPPRRWPQPDTPGWRRVATPLYLLLLTLLTLGVTAWLLNHFTGHGVAGGPAPWLLALATLLLLGPVGEAVVAVVNRLISESAPPARLPRLAFEQGLPPEHRVIVVMPVMLTSAAATAALCAQMEQHHIANPERQAQFALLSDWTDADAAMAHDDDALLADAQACVQALNARHPVASGELHRFLLLHRPRQWSESEQRWIGWERKRGKLEQLVRCLTEPADQLVRPFIDLGERNQPAPDTRYIVTLDADTDMPPGRLRALVGVAAHPLNLPRIDPRTRRVVAGYGILQPRVVTPLPAPHTVTLFHRLFAGQCGFDPYSAASSELYQDVFAEGSFTGKGLLNVQAMRCTLADRLPEGQVLSHDLLEGAIARCASVSDITVVEDAPVHADVANARLHRWTRGDWQLLPFLWPGKPVNAALNAPLNLPLISRWKMLDNLRRSLVAPAALALLLLVLATSVLPWGVALGVVASAFSAGPLLGAVAGLAPSRDDIALRLFYRHALADLGRAAALALWHVAQLLQLALMYSDAIARALWRQAVSRRGLLQWTTAAAAQAAAHHSLPALLRQHVRVPLAAAVLAGLLALADAAGWPVQRGPAVALLLLWAASPLWTWVASKPRPLPERERLAAADRPWLHGLARDTWRYYVLLVTAADNHLPPDNLQLSPRRLVAHRTSPTNIGMYMLSAACAQALGFIGRAELAERLANTLDTLERLPRHHGHFYNWYDTQTGAVLPPAYVSTVDSGNCAAHLLAVAQACEALAREDATTTTGQPAGAAPTLPPVLAQALALSQQRLKPLRPLIDGAGTLPALAALAHADPAWPTTAPGLAALAHQVQQAQAELARSNIAAGDADSDATLWPLHDHVATLASALQDCQAEPHALAQRLRSLASRCRALALAPDFGLLYDRDRRLLHIGWRVDAQQPDDSHYDLLASEARLTSLLAIAKGDVPVAHWAALGRPFFACGTEVGLKSWSGSMFEYLMPSLVLDEPVGSVLHQVTRSAVVAQQAEGAALGAPWGLSESGIAAQDHTLAYQYGPQGVARLALRRTPADERVVAPYASAMALMVAPAAALANLRALAMLGARRTLGFIEALDYTPQRQAHAGQADGTAPSADFTPVHSYMAHHQAMALVAMTDVLTDGGPRRWAMADPMVRAVTALLHERAPREVPHLADPLPLPTPRRQRSQRLVHDSQPLHSALPATQLLTNGRHAVVLREHGAGYSQWDGVALTRWRDDLLRDDRGSFVYLRHDLPEGAATARTPAPAAAIPAWVSLTAHPAPAADASYHCRMQADRVLFDTELPGLSSHMAVWVSPEDDCELRQLELTHTGDQPLLLTLAFAAEVTLVPVRADEAHPAFSNLFVQAAWDAPQQALHFQRRPRLPGEQPVRAVHFLALAEAEVLAVWPCVDRARWLGRYGSAAQPRGDGGADLGADAGSDTTDGTHGAAPYRAGAEGTAAHAAAGTGLPGTPLDTGLDPVAVLQVRLRLAPGASARLVFATAASRQASHDSEVLPALVDKYRQATHCARASSMAHTMAGIRLRELQFDADTWGALLHVNTLLTSLATRELPSPTRGATTAPAPRCDRRLLWRHGLSGDRPMVLVHIASERGLPLVATLKKALRLWSLAAIGVDLVVINAEPPSYLSPVHHQLAQLRERLQHQLADLNPAEQRGALHLLADSALGADDRFTLQSLARLRLQADGRSLAHQVERLLADHDRDLQARRAVPAWPVLPVLPPLGATAGTPAAPPSFTLAAQGGALQFSVTPDWHPSRPWVNVLANAQFGCQVLELGSGFCWAGNSRMHQLTGWSNDALADPASEWLLLQDLDSRRVWPLGRTLQGNAPREVEHGIGYTHMRQRVDGLEVTLTWCVDPVLALRQLHVVVANLGTNPGANPVATPSGPARRLRVVALAEWTLGGARNERLSLVTRMQAVTPAAAGAGLPEPEPVTTLQATQLDHLGGHGGATAFLCWRPPQREDGASATAGPASGLPDRLAAGLPAGLSSTLSTSLSATLASVLLGDDARSPSPAGTDWTCDRREFYDSAGRLVLPTRLACARGEGLDACAALGLGLTVPAGQSRQATLLLGHGDTPEAANALLRAAWAPAPAQRLAAVQASWQQRLGQVVVHTPDPAFNALVNYWLPYQTLACRLWARAGFYQAGGAYGFRDQLQDAMSLVDRDPTLLAAQLRTNAARQFPEGDVQHWWHAPGGAGVRTHFSDDLLWLPCALALYTERTGDEALANESIPYLAGAAVPEGAEDVYETPQVSDQHATLYEHAARAIDHSLRTGTHGLPLMGTGDWNDGMNRVGHGGRGESVWLAWFLCTVVDAMQPLAEGRGDTARLTAWGQARRGWVKALDDAGWDGQWYRRAFFDDGSPLGSAQNSECRIDLIAQAWAVLSGAGNPARARQAMASAQALLLNTNPTANLLPLLDPPLAQAQPSAGYIQAYPAGVRENGGQYNHAAVWALMAWARLGDAAAAWQAFTAVSPAHRWADPVMGPRYAIEPMVMAGDIYTQPPWRGRGGWSWYTGSAGWLARAAVESICGVVKSRGQLTVKPCLPPHWDHARVTVQHQGRHHQVLVCASVCVARQWLARHPDARRARVGEAITLAGLPDGSLHVVCALPAT